MKSNPPIISGIKLKPNVREPVLKVKSTKDLLVKPRIRIVLQKKSEPHEAQDDISSLNGRGVSHVANYQKMITSKRPKRK